ncbi:MAG: agmatine deiminase family protein [Candidatus Margulisiibacteriota bacterium]
MKKIVLFLILSVFTFSTLTLAAAKVEEDIFFKESLLKKMPGKATHLFTAADFRNQFLNVSPQLNVLFTPEFTEQTFAKIQKIYQLEIKTARLGISSDKEMVDFLQQSGLLKELGISNSRALATFKKMDTEGRALKPRADYAKYHTLDAPQTPVVFPGEFEPVGAVYISWPIYDTFAWDRSAELVKEIKTAAPAWIFVPNVFWQKAAQLYLTKKDVTLDNIKFLHIPTNDVWARNWGQMTVLSGKNRSPVFISAPLVNPAAGQPFAKGSFNANVAFGQYMDVPVYELPLVLEQGGNILTDGNGTIITSKYIYHQNPDVAPQRFKKIFKDYYGAEQVIVIPNAPGEVCGHVDIYVKFADPQTVFVASAPKDSLWYESVEKMAKTIADSKSLAGKKYKVVRLPVPSNQILGKDSKDWSYINSLTVNKKVIVPLYGAPEDQQALKIYKETLPDHEVVGVDFHPYFFGAIHCQTQNVLPVVTKERF